MRNKLKTYTLDEAKKRLEHYCAYQDRSHFEVEKKLKEMRMIPEARDMILLHLIQEGFLNEERFARSYARGKFYYKNWGKRKIIQGLKQHQIHRNLIQKALREIDEKDYRETIKDLIQRKKQEYNVSDKYLLKQKLFRFLIQKGYAYEDFADIYSDMENKDK